MNHWNIEELYNQGYTVKEITNKIFDKEKEKYGDKAEKKKTVQEWVELEIIRINKA